MFFFFLKTSVWSLNGHSLSLLLLKHNIHTKRGFFPPPAGFILANFKSLERIVDLHSEGTLGDEREVPPE